MLSSLSEFILKFLRKESGRLMGLIKVMVVMVTGFDVTVS